MNLVNAAMSRLIPFLNSLAADKEPDELPKTVEPERTGAGAGAGAAAAGAARAGQAVCGQRYSERIARVRSNRVFSLGVAKLAADNFA